MHGVGIVLLTLGLTDDQVAGLNGEITAMVGAFLSIAILVIAGKLKPSVKAAEAAKQIDAKLPEGEPVRIPTPGTAPDIYVPAK